MSALDFLKLTLFLTLILDSNLGIWPVTLCNGAAPPPCDHIECPNFDMIESGNGYEIRRYNSIVLVSTSPIKDKGITEATDTSFFKLFGYIQGQNNKALKMEMAAPVVTQVTQSSIVVSFYIPKKYQADPPAAQGLEVQQIGPIYAAVRKFTGFVSDSNLRDELGALIASLSGTSSYGDAIPIAIYKSLAGDPASNYFLAQYNSPFEVVGRTNEIWLTFQI